MMHQRLPLLAALGSLAFAMAACTQTQAPSTPPASSAAASVAASSRSGSGAALRGTMVDYGPTEGYLSLPAGEGVHPAIVLIHEWWGLNDNIKWYADEFAKQGYVALAVNLYKKEATTDPAEAQTLAGEVRDNMDDASANLKAAVDYLKTRPEVQTDRLASVGWCFGGGWSYQMAKNDMGVKATVMYYGQFAPEDDLSMMKAHIIGHFGENDESIPVDDVKAFRAKLETLSGENQVFIYPNEGHGFARELTTESARTAWTRTLDFLKQNL